MLTEPTAKATWQVDTPPAVEAAQPTGKAAVKAGTVKPPVEAPKAVTPISSEPLPSDALEDNTPQGTVRCPSAHVHACAGAAVIWSQMIAALNVYFY